jgi:ketosteroid isomerase-like protein
VSQENVDVARRFTDAYNRGDWDTVGADFDQHIFIRPDPSWPERHIYGREAAIAWYRGIWESVGPGVRIEETMDLGDRVLIRKSWSARGQQSGVAGQQPHSELATLRDGRVVFIEYFLDHADALKAVGLEE